VLLNRGVSWKLIRIPLLFLQKDTHELYEAPHTLVMNLCIKHYLLQKCPPHIGKNSFKLYYEGNSVSMTIGSSFSDLFIECGQPFKDCTDRLLFFDVNR